MKELYQRVSRRVRGISEIIIQFRVVRIVFAKYGDTDIGFLQYRFKPSRLHGRVGVSGEVKDQKGWNILILCNVVDRRKLYMLLGIVPEFLPVTKCRQFPTVKRLTMLGRHDDLGNVVRVSIHGDASLDILQWDAAFFQVPIVCA